jgi:hypothetical protein
VLATITANQTNRNWLFYDQYQGVLVDSTPKSLRFTPKSLRFTPKSLRFTPKSLINSIA